MIDPFGPVGVTVERSMPRSLASLRTGGLASTRVRLGSSTGADVAGTAGSGSAASTNGEARPVSKEAWVWMWVASVPDATLRARRVGPRSAFIRPTRLSPSALPEAAGLDRSISMSLASSPAAGAAGAAPPSAASPTAMIGVPTATVVPSSTRIAVTVPAYGDGSSTRDLAVSISTTMSLTAMTSPTLTFQATISASVRPSPTSGSRYSAMSETPQNPSERSTASSSRSRSGR